jgi:hypothetical protein
MKRIKMTMQMEFSTYYDPDIAKFCLNAKNLEDVKNFYIELIDQKLDKAFTDPESRLPNRAKIFPSTVKVFSEDGIRLL